MTLTANEVFRDFVTDGVPSSGAWKPRKKDIRALLAAMATGGATGLYDFIPASNTGAGTANALKADTAVALPATPNGALLAVNVYEDNTASPVTVQFNGGTVYTVKTNSGNDVAPGGLKAGMVAAGYISGTTFRLLSDQASSSIVTEAEAAAAAAEAAQAAAEAAAAGVNLPPVTTADKYKQLVVKADGSGYVLLAQGVNCAQMGALPSGAAVDTEMAVAIAAAASVNLPLVIPAGTYTFTKAVDFSPLIGGKVILGGEVIFDFEGATNAADFPDYGFVTVIGDPLVRLADLGNAVNAGDTVLLINAVAQPVGPGGRIMLWNPTHGSYNAARTNYYAGECVQVQAVDNASFKTILTGGLYASTAAYNDYELYQHPNKGIIIEGGTLTIKEAIADLGFVAGFRADRIVDSDFSAIRPTNSTYAGMVLVQCIGIHGHGYLIRQRRHTDQGDNYGLVFANCQDCLIFGDFAALKHSVTCGAGDGAGSIVNRNIRVHGTFRNDRTLAGAVGAGIHAADWHGNSEFCHYEGLIDGGMRCSGNHNSVRGAILAHPDALGIAILMDEMTGWDFDFSGVTVITHGQPQDQNRAVIDIGSDGAGPTANTIHGGTFKLDGASIDSPYATQLIVVRNRGCNTSELITVSLRDVTLKPRSAGASYSLITEAVTGKNIDRLDLTGFTDEGNGTFSVLNVSKIRGWRASASVSLTGDTGLSTVSATAGINAPKAPMVSSPNIGDASVVGSKRVIGSASATVSAITVYAGTADGGVFTDNSGTTATVTAYLDEW